MSLKALQLAALRAWPRNDPNKTVPEWFWIVIRPNGDTFSTPNEQNARLQARTNPGSVLYLCPRHAHEMAFHEVVTDWRAWCKRHCRRVWPWP